jgi:hypothetical protein
MIKNRKIKAKAYGAEKPAAEKYIFIEKPKSSQRREVGRILAAALIRASIVLTRR